MPEPIQTPVPAADELAAQVLLLAQSRLTADLRFLSSALEQLKPIPVPALDTLFAGDGRCLYYCPETLLRTFRAQQSVPTRALLHVTLHFLLGHPFQRQEMDHRLWNLACDIAAEEVIRELEIPSCALPDDAMQDSWRSRLQDACPHLTAEAIYNFLLERQYPADVLAELTQLFSRDSHALWYAAPRPCSRPAPNGQLLPAGEDEDITNETELRKTDTRDETLQQMQQRQKEALRRQWKQLARQAKTDLETFSRRHGKRAGALMDGLEPVTFEECDYTDFLRRFGAQNEVLQLSEDEFDLIYYTYGLRTYGNIPLVEPLEYRDDKRIREFVIAIDTSGSVQGDIVQSFLQRTCDVLRQSGSFTERVEIYLIQCDAEVQSVERLTSLDQLHELIPRLKLRGFGGTDFRPVFAYVDRLLEEKKLTNLNGLLYFTDGVGTYPEKSPAYKTAFIFNRDDHISPHVPSWAIRAVLTTDNIRLLEPQKTRTEEDTESWIKQVQSNRSKIPYRSTCRRTLWATTDFRWCTSGPSSCWVRQVWARLPLCSRSLMRWGLAL